jgi:KaiC/GvpD/RAD55 family RecA-like ATPase
MSTIDHRYQITLTDTQADYLLNGLVKLIVDGRPGDARSAVVKADETLLESPIDRDLFRAIRRALEYRQSPSPLDVKFLVEHDPDGSAPVDEVVSRLERAKAVAKDIGWEHHVDSAIQHLRGDLAARLAGDLGRELVAASVRPTPERCDEIVRLARQMQERASSAGRPAAANLLDIVDRWQKSGSEKLLATGFRPIDKPLGGGLPVGLHAVAAAPGAGKSALAIQLAAGVLERNADARVLWFRGEMTNELVLSRLLACWSRLRGDRLEPITLRDALRRSSDCRPVYLDLVDVVADRLVVVDPPITLPSVERWIDETRPALVVVDYMQQIQVDGFRDRRAELDHAVRRLSLAATRAEIPVVVVSSVSMQTTEQAGIGRMTKESNALDFEAHTYWSLWPQGDKADKPRRIALRSNKNRTGETIDDDLWFHGAHQFYEPAAAPIYEEFGGFPLP